MGQQSVRQVARRAVLDAQAARRRERVERERRLEGLALDVLLAVGERDSAIQETERRAGEALRAMTGDGGLSIHQAAEWCGGQLTVREATRLRRIVTEPTDAGDSPGTPPVTGPPGL